MGHPNPNPNPNPNPSPNPNPNPNQVAQETEGLDEEAAVPAGGMSAAERAAQMVAADEAASNDGDALLPSHV